jgi:hypothetical protein
MPENERLFRSKPKEYYHEEMMANTFKDCFFKCFINHLEEGSIIITESASYHSL